MSEIKDHEILESWSKEELAIHSQKRNEGLQAQFDAEVNPRRALFHKFVVLVEFVVGISALNMLVGQIVGFYFQEIDPIQFVLRLYVIVLCLLAILIETEFTKFARESKILTFWVTRGLFYVFIGVIGLEENDSTQNKNTESKEFDISYEYIKAVAWIMVASGFFYFLMGICCLQIYYSRLREDYETRLAKAPEVRETVERYSVTSPSV